MGCIRFSVTRVLRRKASTGYSDRTKNHTKRPPRIRDRLAGLPGTRNEYGGPGSGGFSLGQEWGCIVCTGGLVAGCVENVCAGYRLGERRQISGAYNLSGLEHAVAALSKRGLFSEFKIALQMNTLRTRQNGHNLFHILQILLRNVLQLFPRRIFI